MFCTLTFEIHFYLTTENKEMKKEYKNVYKKTQKNKTNNHYRFKCASDLNNLFVN